MVSQAWYAAPKAQTGKLDTRFAVTYTYCCTLSTLPGVDFEQAQCRAIG